MTNVKYDVLRHYSYRSRVTCGDIFCACYMRMMSRVCLTVLNIARM